MSLKKRSAKLLERRPHGFILKKTVEELTELTLALIQKETKKDTSKPITEQEVIDEVGDVKRYIWYLESIYGKDRVKKRIKDKVKSLEKKYT